MNDKIVTCVHVNITYIHAYTPARVIGRMRKCSNSFSSFTQKHRKRSNIIYNVFYTQVRTRVRAFVRACIIHTFLCIIQTQNIIVTKIFFTKRATHACIPAGACAYTCTYLYANIIAQTYSAFVYMKYTGYISFTKISLHVNTRTHTYTGLFI